MPKLFSVASWNVEHFKNKESRVQRVIEFLKGMHNGPVHLPDIFALYEVEGKDIFHPFMRAFPDYHFHLTEGKQTQEIFVGIHKKLQTFSTQRIEFKTQRDYQRPGLLLSVHLDSKYYPILFLHIRSGSKTEDFGLRDAALNHAFNLKMALDKRSDEPSNFIFLGDLNTMGIDDPVPYSKELNFSADEEVERLGDWADKREMKLLDKEAIEIHGVNREVTWYNGSDHYEPTNLDHVIASNHLNIHDQDGTLNSVSILGWPQLPREQWNYWFNQFSDHAMMYFEVWE